MTPVRGEVWLFDLGMAEKVRPAVATYPSVRAIRKLGRLNKDHFETVFSGLLRWLGHDADAPL